MRSARGPRGCPRGPGRHAALPPRSRAARRLAVGGDDLRTPAESLRAQEAGCRAASAASCARARNTIVFGSGNPEADLVVIGEGPGADEDAQGLPFVGRAGQLLTKMLESVKITRDEVYITNMVLCRPPGNRNPEADEMAACAPFLADTARRDPARGDPARWAAWPPRRCCVPRSRSASSAASLHTYGAAVLIPTFHPAFLLRNPGQEYKRMAWDDLKLAKREYDARRTR